MKKAFWATPERNKFTQPLLCETSCGISVMEFPIIFDDYKYGLFSVGVSSETDMEKYHSVISSLATASGIAIHLLNKERE